MSEAATGYTLGIERQGRMRVYEYALPALREGQFRVETLYSGVSAGTELTFLKGTNPYLHSSWDADLCLFAQDQPARSYPIQTLGYMEVGRVIESLSSAVPVGAVVAMACGHKTLHDVDAREDFYVPLPADLDPILGIYVAQMGPICANGLLHAAADVVGQDVRALGDGVRGRNVLVLGAGVVALLTAGFSVQHGAASVVVAGRGTDRLSAARALGAAVIDDERVDVAGYCKERWHQGPNDRGADVVFQCRGQTAYLATALKSLRPQGTVIDLAFYQGGAPDVRLGEEFHHNGLTVRCAQIARVPRGLGHLWNRARLANETIQLLRERGDLIKQHMVSDVVPLGDAATAITELAERKREAVQIVLEMNGSTGAS